MSDEADIIINGHQLTRGQSIALHKALGNFLTELDDDTYMQELGRVGPIYKEDAEEVLRIMINEKQSS